MLFYPRKIAETKLIARDSATIIFWFGLLMLVPMLFSILFLEVDFYWYAIIAAVISTLAYLLKRRFKNTEAPFSRFTIVTIAATWLICSLLGALPFFFMSDMTPLDAVFESISSISTAGFTTIEYVESMPASLLFWRALLAWLGGIGITAIAFYTLMQSDSISRLALGEGFERIKPSLVNSAREIFKIYVFWTVFGILALSFIGVPLFDSVNISFNAVSTTGVDVRDAGWLYYQQTLPETFPIMAVIVGLLMLVGSVSFLAHYRLLKSKRIMALVSDSETKAYFAILLIGMGLIAGYLWLQGGDAAPMAYEAMSIATTGGFEIVPYLSSMAGDFSMAILIILALIGGSAHSAAGGLKVRRVVLLFKYVFWKVGTQLSPEGTVSHFKFDGHVIKPEEVMNAAVYMFIYVAAIIIISTFIISFGYGPADTVLMVTSAQAGGGISPIPAYELFWPAKLALMGTMLFGRLEFLPMFALMLYAVRRK